MVYGIYKEGRWEEIYMAQKSRNGIAVVWVMRMGGGNIKGCLILAHTQTSEI